MDPKTAEFLVFTAFNAACLTGGYLARQRGWISEHISQRLHYFTVVVVWALISLLSVWAMPMRAQNLWILVVTPALVFSGAMLGLGAARLLGCSRQAMGVLALASGLGNLGFTLGAYLSYCLLEPRIDALSYGIVMVTVMQVTAVPILYPIARHYGQHRAGDQSMTQLVIHSFLDLRAMALYAAIVGLGLAGWGVAPPRWMWDYNFMTALFYLGAFGSLFGIGMKIRLGDAKRYLKEHAALTAIKFIAFPLMTWGLLTLIDLTPLPLNHTLKQVFMIEAFMPTGLLTVMLANLFHLDTRLASMAWLWNSVLFIVGPLPMILWWYA